MNEVQRNFREQMGQLSIESIQCRGCGKTIVKGVTKCSHCGNDQRNFLMRHKLWGVFTILVFWGGITEGNKGITVESIITVLVQTIFGVGSLAFLIFIGRIQNINKRNRERAEEERKEIARLDKQARMKEIRKRYKDTH